MEMERMRDTYQKLEGEIIVYHKKLLALVGTSTATVQPGH